MGDCQNCSGCKCKDKVLRFTHPNWELPIILSEQEGGLEVALGFLNEGDDPKDLKSEVIEITRTDLKVFPEWEA